MFLTEGLREYQSGLCFEACLQQPNKTHIWLYRENIIVCPQPTSSPQMAECSECGAISQHKTDTTNLWALTEPQITQQSRCTKCYSLGALGHNTTRDNSKWDKPEEQGLFHLVQYHRKFHLLMFHTSQVLSAYCLDCIHVCVRVCGGSDWVREFISSLMDSCESKRGVLCSDPLCPICLKRYWGNSENTVQNLSETALHNMPLLVFAFRGLTMVFLHFHVRSNIHKMHIRRQVSVWW